MFDRYNPETAPRSRATYSQGVAAPAGARWLYVAGQVGLRPDETLAPTPEEQVEQAWSNVLAILKEAGMGPENLVHVTTYITGPELVEPNRKIWGRISPDAGFASTMVTVARLSDPDWVVEVQAVAAG